MVETCCDSVVDVVFVECLVLNSCCVVMFAMFCVIYGRITFSSVFAITDRRDIGLYDVCVRFGNRYVVGEFPYLWYFVVVECGIVYVREVF